jgi:translocator protein
MRSDKLRQAVTVLSFLITLAVNAAANALPIGGLTTGAISDRFHVFVIPAGYVFAIWGVIYLLLAGFTVWQALPRNREDASLRAIGWLPALTGVLNATWLLLFQYQAFALTVPVILALLLTLIAIHRRLWAHRSAMRGTAFWTVRVPFSVYLGWITVATIANIAQAGSALGFDGFGADPALVATAVLLLGLAIAATFVRRFGDAAYGLVIVWAYLGIAVKESATPPVALTAAIGAAVIAVLVVGALTGRARGARGVTASPTGSMA